MIPEQDFERLSAYLDDELSPAEKGRLEARLSGDTELSAALSDLRRQARALRGLPAFKSPRNFTLTVEQARALRRPRPRFFEALFPALRLTTSLSAAAFALVLAAAVMTPALPAAAPLTKEAAGGAALQEAPAAALAVDATPAPEALFSASAPASGGTADTQVESYGTGAEPPANDAARQAAPAETQTPELEMAAPSALPAPLSAAPATLPLANWAWGLGALTAALAAGWATLAWLARR